MGKVGNSPEYVYYIGLSERRKIMLSTENVFQLIHSLIWLLAGVGVFIVGMNFLSGALEKSASGGMKKLLEKISNNRFSGVGIGAGVTAIVQSSSATSVMVIGLVNAGAMTLMQATPIIMGANIGTTVTGILVSLKNDYFNIAMYLLAFAGVMMGFAKKEKIKLAGSLCSGLGLIFVGLNIMSSEQAFGNELVEQMFTNIFSVIDFPLLLILIGAIFTALLQSSSAATGIVITMVGTGVLPLGQALFIILGANIGTCITALLASAGANTNSKRVALIHFSFNIIGTALFTVILWTLGDHIVNILTALSSGEDQMALQMRVSIFHVVFNVSTTLILLPFVKHLVKASTVIIKDKKEEKQQLSLKYVDERLLTTPSVALMEVKNEMNYMFSVVEENITLSFSAIQTGSPKYTEQINQNEEIIDFTNSTLTKFLIKLAGNIEESDDKMIGAYFHVLNDLERIGDHAENFHEMAAAMSAEEKAFSPTAHLEIKSMCDTVMKMFALSKDAFENINRKPLTELSVLENKTDKMKSELIASHYARLAEGSCKVETSPYYSSLILGLERVADHLVNVGYSIVNPTGSQREN